MIETPISEGDPVQQLVFLLSKGSTITRISDSPIAGNGLPYCYVEVAEPRGSHYILHAYGQEAAVLYDMATKHITT